MSASETATVSSRPRWAVAAMFFANGFILGAWAPQIPLFLARLGISETTLGLLILGFGLGALVAMPLAGWMIARHGSKATLSVIAIACSLGLAIVVASPNVIVAAAALAIFGAVFGGMDVTMNANAVAVERRLGRAIMSSSHGFWSLGGFVGGLTGGFVIQQVGAMGHALIVCAIALAMVLAALPSVIDDDRPQAHERVAHSFPRSVTLYVLGFIALFSMIPEGAVVDWAALYLAQEHGSTVATAGWGYAAFAGSMALMRFAGDRIRDRFGGVATLRVSALISAAGMFAAAFAPSAPLAIAFFALAGLGIANMVPVVFSAAGNHPGVASGAAMSVVTTIGYSGILIAPSAMGFIGDHVGFVPVFAGVAVMLALVAAVAGVAHQADHPN
ncbi:MAG: MFS transporter [Proteobacteria bacterium]|nr:MFS transporter [Pseudomonadota bacterium]